MGDRATPASPSRGPSMTRRTSDPQEGPHHLIAAPHVLIHHTVVRPWVWIGTLQVITILRFTHPPPSATYNLFPALHPPPPQNAPGLWVLILYSHLLFYGTVPTLLWRTPIRELGTGLGTTALPHRKEHRVFLFLHPFWESRLFLRLGFYWPATTSKAFRVPNMKAITWNVKGLRSPNKWMKVIRLLKRYKLDAVFLQESHLPESDFQRLINYGSRAKRGLLLWYIRISLKLLFCMKMIRTTEYP